MAVVIEAFTVIVRNSTLNAKYPGGREAYATDCSNQTYCDDGTLSRVSFMHSDDANEFIGAIEKKGLVPSIERNAVDVALVSASQGLHARACDWLLFSTYKGVPIVWANGTRPGPLVAPSGYKFGHTSYYVSPEEARDRLVYVRTENFIDVYRDKATGKEMYMGRTPKGGAG